MKQKICKSCKKKFTPERQFQTTCCFECASNYAKENAIKNAQKNKRKEIKQLKDNDIAVLKRLAQTTINKYIRLRDNMLPCISCGYFGDNRQWHAGHYMPMGSNGAIRYHEDNIHKQCSICNNHLSGNLANYRLNLIQKIGLEKVEWLESQKQPKKWTLEELREIITKYREKIKDIR